MHTVVIDNIQAFHGVKAPWLTLMDKSFWCSVFSTPEWNYSWWRIYGHDKELCVWTLQTEQNALAGVYPLYIEKKQGVRWLCPLGYPRHADISGIVADSAHAMAVHAAFFAWLGLQNSWNVAQLANVPLESLPAQRQSNMRVDTADNIWSGLARKAGIKSMLLPADPCMLIPLRSADFEDDRPGKTEFRTCKRKLKELNRHFRDATVVQTPLNKERLDAIVKLSVEKSRAYSEGKSFFNPPEAEQFMRDLAEHEHQSFELRLFTLHLNEKLAAYELTYLWRNSLLVYARGYDQDYAKYSPGIYLLCNALNDSFESKNIYSLNLLLGGEAYKDAFVPIKVEQATYTFFNKNAFGYFYMLKFGVRNALKKAYIKVKTKFNH